MSVFCVVSERAPAMRCTPKQAFAPLQSWCPSVLFLMTVTCLVAAVSPDTQDHNGPDDDIASYVPNDRLARAKELLRKHPLIDG